MGCESLREHASLPETMERQGEVRGEGSLRVVGADIECPIPATRDGRDQQPVLRHRAGEGMNHRRVLEVGYAGGSIRIYAEIDGDHPVRLSYRIAGFSEWENEEPQLRVYYGPWPWEELLARVLEPAQWLRLFPLFVHPCMMGRVRVAILEAAVVRREWRHLVQATRLSG